MFNRNAEEMRLYQLFIRFEKDVKKHQKYDIETVWFSFVGMFLHDCNFCKKLVHQFHTLI